MLAHRIKLDVLDQNNLARFGAEDRAVYDLIEVLPISVSEELERARGAGWRSEQTFTLRVFSDRLEQIQKRFFHPLQLRCAATWNTSDAALGRFELGLVIVHQSSQLCGYFSSSSATACSVSSSVCWVSSMTASSSVRSAFLLAMIVPGCGPCVIPRGCSVIDAGSIPRRDPKFPRT